MKKATGPLSTQKFLFRYRITPHTTTGRPPAEFVNGEEIEIKIVPDVAKCRD